MPSDLHKGHGEPWLALDREEAFLLMIDVQERLFPAMDSDHREEVMRNLKVLAATAQRLQLPTLATEQYPKGLGHTLPELLETLGAEAVFVGSGIFKSDDPEKRARAIVKATTHWRDAEALLEAEESLGSGMKGIEAASLSEEAQLQTRGW